MLSRRFAAQGVSIPLFGDDKTRPAATIWFDKLELGAQRRGFFRIGVLPLAVATGVQIRFQRPDPSAFADLAPSLKTLAKTDVLELRNVAIYSLPNEEPILKAGLVEVEGGGDWKLSKLQLRGGRHIEEARLAVDGPHAGELTFSGSENAEPEGTERKMQILQ